MRSLAKVAAFIVVFAAVIAGLHFIISSLFRSDPGLLLHHGVGQVTFYLLFILNVFLFQTYVNREGFLSLGLRPYAGWYVTVLKGWAAGIVAFVGYSFLMRAFGIVDFIWRPGIERIVERSLTAEERAALAASAASVGEGIRSLAALSASAR